MGLTVTEASAFDLLETLDDMGARARFTRLLIVPTATPQISAASS